MKERNKKLKSAPVVIAAIFTAQGLESVSNHEIHDESIEGVHTHNEFRLIEPAIQQFVAPASGLTQNSL